MFDYKTYIGRGNVTCFDSRGNSFYNYFPHNNEPFFFNINISDCRFTGDVWETDRKLIYKVKLPSKVIRMPRITVDFTSGGPKASINLDTGRITVDKKYLNYPSWAIQFLIGHEIAHFIYPSKNGIRTASNESKCDIVSGDIMLSVGYNPSQIGMAMKFVLGSGQEQDHRWYELIKHLQSVKHKFVS